MCYNRQVLSKPYIVLIIVENESVLKITKGPIKNNKKNEFNRNSIIFHANSKHFPSVKKSTSSLLSNRKADVTLFYSV